MKNMSIRKPLLPECFLHWTEAPNASGDEVLRIVSWRRTLTLKGKSFQEFETEVLPLLTGAFSIDEISEKVARVFRKEDLIASLDMLASQGIVVEGDTATTQNAQPDMSTQLNWLGETAPDGREAQHKLTDAHVVIFGAGSHGAVAARSLVAAGVGRLTIVDPASVQPTDPYFSSLFQSGDIGQNRADVLAAALAERENQTALKSHATRPGDAEAIKPLIAGASLILCCLDSGEMNLALKLNIACHDLGINWIAASLEGTELVVGPGFFQSDDGPCYLCWRMREIAGAANPQTRYAFESRLDQLQSDLSGRRENLAVSADIVGGMLSAEALTWLTGTSTPNLDGRFVVVGLPGLRMEKHAVLRKPGCPVCGGGLAAPR
jgi:adenylyltransferase/sulfurtransferase